MGKIKSRIILILVATCCLVAALLFALLPSKAFADTASETVTAQKSRNEKLIVKYDLNETSTAGGNTIAAYTWDNTTQSYQRNTAADGTVDNSGGAVSHVSGVEGGGALSFTSKANVEAPFKLNEDSMTISMWVKNSNTYWSALVEFWDGAGHGGKFGKGSMMANAGGKGVWGQPGNSNSHEHAVNADGADNNWDSFVVSIEGGEHGGEDVRKDRMNADQWYQVTYVISKTELKAYRDGVLKLTYNIGAVVPETCNSIITAAQSNTGKIGIRSGTDPSANADIVDDFRIYSGSMSDTEVASLYGEYRGLSAIKGKTVTVDGVEGTYTVDNGSNVRVSSNSENFPKILIGDVTAGDVTLSDNEYSASGDGYSYTYTVGEYVANERVATVTYTANSITHTFTVTQVNPDIVTIKLTSLQVKINDGAAQSIEGFDADVRDYTLALTPDQYKVEFVVTIETGEGYTSNVADVNAAINYNGKNYITTSKNGTDSLTYAVTISRNPAHQATPSINGSLISSNSVVYVDAVPESNPQIDLVYPNGSEVKDLVYSNGVITSFKVEDKQSKSYTEYSNVTLRAKAEGNLAYWSFDEGKDGNKVFAGKRWDAAQNKYVEVSSLDMTVRGEGCGNGQEVTDTRNPVAATQVTGVLGNGIELAEWNYTTAAIPAHEGTTTGFTFSTWMKTEGIVWEAVFAVLGNEHGTILEKGHMQTHNVENGQPIGGWGHLADATGVWEDSSLNDNDKKKNYYNTPSQGNDYVFYTATVTYVNGVGTVKFYKDGVLASTHTDSNATNKAQYIIDAINNGAKVGLHRHHYDGGFVSKFDETNVYAYAMTAEEVANAYAAYADLKTIDKNKTLNVTGLGYDEPLYTGVTESGATVSGVTYYYTPVTGEATSAKDSAGVAVALRKANVGCEAKVTYNRTLPDIAVTKLGYQIGTNAAAQLDVEAGKTVYEVVVNADVDLTTVTKGTTVITGDSGDGSYTIDYSYTDNVATYDCHYTNFPDKNAVYTITFRNKSTETFSKVTVTGAKTDPLELAIGKFKNNVGKVDMADGVDSYTLSVTVTLADGATMTSTTFSITPADLTDGKYAFTVTNENGDAITYYIEPVVRSSVKTLSSLTIEGYAFDNDATFSPTTYAYTITTDKGGADIIYERVLDGAVKTDEKATLSKGYDRTGKVITITVEAEDETTQDYVITVIELDTDATLSEIKADGVAIADFDSETTDYIVKYLGDLPTITATKSSATASVVVGEPVDNVVTITVTAENGKATKTYTVTLVEKSSVATLTKLTLNGTEVTFENNTAAYSAPAGTRLNDITVVAETAEGATASYTVNTDENKIIVTVTAEDGTTTATYTVNISIQSNPPADGGVTEDNSPKSGGCGSSVGGITISVVAIALFAGVWLFVKKARKTH